MASVALVVMVTLVPRAASSCDSESSRPGGSMVTSAYEDSVSIASDSAEGGGEGCADWSGNQSVFGVKADGPS
jgi:hypothetical protein